MPKPLQANLDNTNDLLSKINTILTQFRAKIDNQPKLNEQSYNDLLQTTLRHLLPVSHQIPLPAQGNTLLRWQILAKVAACDLNLVKYFEAHLDALAILAELNVNPIPEGLWAVWAAEGGQSPLQFDGNFCTGTKLWCSGASLVDYALVSFRDSAEVSQLLSIDMQQPNIQINQQDWQAVGMPYTATATVQFDKTTATLITSNQFENKQSAYLDRVGFWHGAAGVAACWYGASAQLAQWLVSSCEQKPHPFKTVILGEVSHILTITKQYFEYVATVIDYEPNQKHEFIIRVLRNQSESAASQILTLVGRALGATPYCKDAHFARLSADLAVFIRQTHGAFDDEMLGKLSLAQLDKIKQNNPNNWQGALWQL